MLMRARPALPVTPWLLLPCFALLIGAILATGPVYDVDSYWHVLMGRDIWAEHRLSGDPNWTFGPSRNWATTQWGSEALMAGLVSVFGWGGLTVLRAVCALLIAVGLARLLLPGDGQAVRAVLCTIIGLGVLNDVHERPGAVSFVFLLVVAAWARRALADGIWPVWWHVAALTIIWANLHGYWVLLPVTITLVAVGRAWERRTVGEWRTPFFVALASTVAGAATPSGIHGYTAPLTFASAASGHVQEWERATITVLSFLAVLIVAAFVASAWARTGAGTAEVLYVLFWVGFASLAVRNASPALLLIAPVAAERVGQAFTGGAVRPTLLTKVTLLAVLVAVPLTGAARLITLDRLPETTPFGTYEMLAATGPAPRVINDYNLGGQILALVPGARVAVDGRADRYGNDTIGDYLDALDAKPGWQATLRRYPGATDAVLRTDRALVEALQRDGWTVRSRDDHYVHLTAPGVTR